MTASRRSPVAAPGAAALVDAAWLGGILGPVAAVERAPLGALGYSGSRHERLAVRLGSGELRGLLVKRLRPAEVWTAARSGDAVGREAALLAEPALAGVWEVFRCPYLAYAVEDGEVSLLMDDLGAHLWPDVDEPLAAADEDVLLGALAALHARFWGSDDALALPWLVPTAAYLDVLGPGLVEGPEPQPLGGLVRDGWLAALARVPAPVRELLTTPATALAAPWADLPRTLLHGDAKIANFARLPDGAIAAFDWALVGAAPVGVELGWYLAVNAGRLARPKEQVAARYRSLLEAARGERLGDELWRRLVGVAVVAGARMLLWEKALNAAGPPSGRARAEWDWWVAALAARA